MLSTATPSIAASIYNHADVQPLQRATLSPATLQPVEWELPYQALWPVAASLLDREAGVVFLDAAGRCSADARWSLLAWNPRRTVVWPQGRPGAVQALRDLLPATSISMPSAESLHGGIPFHGGWMGWFAYDFGRHLEEIPVRAAADASVPDFVLGEYGGALIEDRVERRLYAAGSVSAGCETEDLRRRLVAVLNPHMRRCPPPARSAPPASFPQAHMGKEEYLRAVERVLQYIVAGDVYQANFAHRFDAEYVGPSLPLYARLRAASPAPFGGYLGLPGAPEIFSVSPEMFLDRRNGFVRTAPIKGTRPRHSDPVRDAALRAELERSPKERAELLMIVDLLRNDLGRVARTGSVRVDTLREPTSHPTVHHASARISAGLDDDVDTAALLAATFPGGSVTGAPKIRAMEILEELEPVRRGAYTGSAGFIGYDGRLRLNILIRTLVRQGTSLHFHVGGGIVADSDPEAEYDETMAKGAAMFRALPGCVVS